MVSNLSKKAGFEKNKIELSGHGEDVIKMRKQGNTYDEIKDFLMTKGIIVHKTTINRYFLKNK